MGQKTLFDGKLYTEPTSKSKIISGVRNFGSPSTSGNVLIIDTGAGAGYGLGAGVENAGGTRQITDAGVLSEFNSASEMKNGVKGGKIWDLASYLYNPHPSQNGASKVYLMRAALTAAASVTLAAGATTETIVITSKEEGTFLNGVIGSGSGLTSGYGAAIEAGTVDTAKFVLKIYRSSYRGVDAGGLLYDGITAAEAELNDILVYQSNEYATMATLTAGLDLDEGFTALFSYTAAAVTENLQADALTVFAGGTETYSKLSEALDLAAELEFSLILCLDLADATPNTNNSLILSFIQNDAAFKKFAFIGGGGTKAAFSSISKVAALAFDSRYGVICHHSFKVPYVLNQNVDVLKDGSYFAAAVCGLHAGMPPQTPATYKPISTGVLDHVLSENERVDAIDSGVLHLKFVRSLGWVINQAINTKQANSYLINADGSSPEISVERIIAQVNREIAEGAEPLFVGGNRFSVTASDLVTYAAGYLETNSAEAGKKDGMIINYSNVKAVRTGTVWAITYDFEANTPINKVFSTGTLIDESLFV